MTTIASPALSGQEIYCEIGRRIRAARLRLKVNQDALAYCVGFQRAISISEIEHGKVRVQIDTLYAIARALGVSLLDLLPEVTS